MKFKNIAIFGDNTLGNELGKKGTQTDITFYNRRQDEDVLNFVEATEFPDRVQTLFYAINLTDAALIKVNAITRTLGEIIVALDCMEVKKGYIVLGEGLIKEQVAPLLKGTNLENYEFIENDRIKIIDHLSKAEIPSKEGNTRIPIDHFFDVKNVGTVVLGTVRGNVKKFDEFIVYPTDKRVTVKAVRIYDEEVESAGSGCRVGLNLKGIRDSELERGYVLAREGEMMVKREIDVKFKVQKFWRYPLYSGNKYAFICGLQQLGSKVKEVKQGELRAGEEGVITLELDWKLSHEKGDKIALLRPDLPDNRIVGVGEII